MKQARNQTMNTLGAGVSSVGCIDVHTVSLCVFIIHNNLHTHTEYVLLYVQREYISYTCMYKRKKVTLSKPQNRHFDYIKSKGKGKVFPLQARLWSRGWVEV
jgi:hypothetical protein